MSENMSFISLQDFLKAMDKSNAFITKAIIKFQQHRGESVMHFHKEKRDIVPVVAEIVAVYSRFVLLRHKAFSPTGEFRQYLYQSVSYSSLYCGSEVIKFLDDLDNGFALGV